MASKWITALVEPPSAPFARTAFKKFSRVSTFEMRRSSLTISTIRRPVSCEITRRRLSTAGIAAQPGRLMPSASAMLFMVEAVPMTLQCPGERELPASAAMKSSSDISPARTASEKRQTWVPEPSSSPRNLPFSIGPPEQTIAGTSQLAAPIRRAGVVLSQPVISTTPSTGLPRMASSTSIAARFRNSIAVGRRLLSPVENTGNSSGKPPAS